jgi:hypothetical protein
VLLKCIACEQVRGVCVERPCDGDGSTQLFAMYFVSVVGLMDGVSACCAGCSHNTIVIHGDFDGVIVRSIDNPDAGNVQTSSMAIPANILRRSRSKRLPFILSNVVHGDIDIAKLDKCRTLSFVHRDIDDCLRHRRRQYFPLHLRLLLVHSIAQLMKQH